MSRETNERQDRLEQMITEHPEPVDAGQSPEPEMYLKQYPDLADDLWAFFQAQTEIGDSVANPGAPEGMRAI